MNIKIVHLHVSVCNRLYAQTPPSQETAQGSLKLHVLLR